MSIYRQGPQQPWRNHVLRHGTLARVTALAEYVPPVYADAKRTYFAARPKAHHGRQQGAPVLSIRRMPPTELLPNRHNASPIPQGSNRITGAEPDYYGDEWYGEAWYGE